MIGRGSPLNIGNDMSNSDFKNKPEQNHAMDQLLYGMMELAKFFPKDGSDKITTDVMLDLRRAIQRNPDQNWMDALSKGQMAS